MVPLLTLSGVQKFKAKFPFMKEYTIDMLLPGTAGDMDVRGSFGEVTLIWGGLMNPSFFDSEMIGENNDLLCSFTLDVATLTTGSPRHPRHR